MSPLSLLTFFLGVLNLMSNPKRVLEGSEQYGSRIITVDSQGNGDFTNIQAAIDAANGQSPTADSRWLIRIAPGEYQESLTLYDYIDLAGYAPGSTAYLKSPASTPAIANGAECTISNLRIGGDNDPVIMTGATFTGVMIFSSISVSESDASLTLFQVTSGSVEIYFSTISFGGRVAYITAGALRTYASSLTEYNTDSGGDAYPVLVLDHASASLEAYFSEISNQAASGSAALGIYNASASAILHACVIRKASGSYSIDTNTTPIIYLANCAANAAINPAILGSHDVQVDAGY